MLHDISWLTCEGDVPDVAEEELALRYGGDVLAHLELATPHTFLHHTTHQICK
jgi:hypothetical protein